MASNQGVEALLQIREELRDPVQKKRFVDSQRERWGWTGWTYRQAHSRVDHMLDPEDHHFLPVEALADAIEILGHAEFLDPLLALEQRVQRAKRGVSHTVTPLGAVRRGAR
jgi:hypothetical protein